MCSISSHATCCGQGPTIHPSGQIEWYNNFIDDKSAQEGGKQVIMSYHGYIIPLVSREELMYLEFLGKPTIDDLTKYPSVHLASPHPWDLGDGGEHRSPTGTSEGSKPKNTINKSL